MTDALTVLRAERDKFRQRLAALETAIRALDGGRKGRTGARPKQMSAAARKRISQAQKARWAAKRKESKAK
jgi:hypothetical protein